MKYLKLFHQLENLSFKGESNLIRQLTLADKARKEVLQGEAEGGGEDRGWLLRRQRTLSLIHKR